MTTETTSWVGLVLSGGRYLVKGRLGEGGMALVFRAHDRNLDTEVVLKVPRPTMLEDADFAGRFSRETRMLVRLAHPHITKILDVGDHEGCPFAVMQYLAGGSLADRLRSFHGQKASDRTASLGAWLEQIAAALDFIHSQHHVHRDVKPDNILFDGDGHAFLSDFGIAKVLADAPGQNKKTVMTRLGMVLGTGPYMAPEVLLGESYDGRADQYALAVTVYEVLSGKVPFDGVTPAAVMLQQTSGDIASLHKLMPTVPAALCHAVQKALSRKSDQRFPSCRDFARAVTSSVEAGAVGTAKNLQTVKGESLQATCPGCGKSSQVPMTTLGKRLRCPDCQTVFVPAGPGVGAKNTNRSSQPSAAALEREARPPARPAEKANSKTAPKNGAQTQAARGTLVGSLSLRTRIILASLGSVVALLLVALLVKFVLLPGPQTPKDDTEANQARSEEKTKPAKTSKIGPLSKPPQTLTNFEEAEILLEKKKTEEARILAEQKKAEEARILAEQKKAEEARILAEQKKAEEARILAEQKKAEEARILAEQKKVKKLKINDKDFEFRGTFTSNDPKDAQLLGPTQTHLVRFKAGQIYSIDMVSNEVDSYLRLLDVKGMELNQDDDGGGGLNSRIIFNCAKDGVYKIVCTTFTPRYGNYALSVKSAADAAKTNDLIVGKWTMEKKEKDKDLVFTFEFGKDGKMKVSAVFGKKDFSVEGTYKVLDEKTVETTLTDPGKKEPGTAKLKIETLTKTKLTLVTATAEKLELERVKGTEEVLAEKKKAEQTRIFAEQKKYAEQGDARGQNYLGWAYANALGVAKDDVEAVWWYRKAAEQGNAHGQCNLGWMYANGRGVAKDVVEAVKWYRKSAEQGNARAQINLGLLYEVGLGVAKDAVEAVKWYRKSAEQGDDWGQFNLGRAYEFGIGGVVRDVPEARRWYQMAANQGHQRAVLALKTLK